MTDYEDLFKTRENKLLDKLRSSLASSFPDVRKLEGLENLDVLHLSCIFLLDDIVLVKYYAHAPKIYPNVKKELIQRKMAEEQNIFHDELINKGMPNEHVDTRLEYYSNSLQIFLQVYKEKQES